MQRTLQFCVGHRYLQEDKKYCKVIVYNMIITSFFMTTDSVFTRHLKMVQKRVSMHMYRQERQHVSKEK